MLRTRRSGIGVKEALRHLPEADEGRFMRETDSNPEILNAGGRVTRTAAIEQRTVDDAIERGVAFLEAVQCPSGEFPVLIATDPTMAAGGVPDPSVFPTALIARSLSGRSTAKLRERACDFLLGQVDPDGLWRHWTRDHPYYRQLPPDLDDTSCASSALRSAGKPYPDNRAILLANRDSQGRFYTWIAPRLRWAGTRHLILTARQLRHAATLFLFFRRTSAKPRDVDAVVNANALFYLGPFDGRDAVVSFLVDVVRNDRETECDKWYDNPFVIWYFLSRALSGIAPEAKDMFVSKITSADPRSPLEDALAACALLYWDHLPSEEAIARLLGAQNGDGAWPIAALYHGGRARMRDGNFDKPHPDTPRWGSEALTTAFAIEALSALSTQRV
jgi:hypothetical protein